MRTVGFVLLVMAALGIGACKQADGDMPARTGEVPARLVDLGRDIDNVVSGDQQAVIELTDDLTVFTEEPEGISAIRALSGVLCPMLVERSLNEETRSRLATILWTTVAARDLSERQIDGLKDDMRELLMSIGVSQPDANLAAGWVANVQKTVTQRNRRWYERY